MIHQQERLHLANMFFTNGGSSWNINTSWLEAGDHCAWYGVACNGNSMVTSLQLQNNNLSGPMTDLSVFPSLDNIVLDINDLSGPIPDNVCMLSSTIFLQVDDDLCEDPGTADGCCDKVRTGDVTIDDITSSVLGSADCEVVGTMGGAIDATACTWMEEETNHPLNDVEAHTAEYLTVSKDFAGSKSTI